MGGIAIRGIDIGGIIIGRINIGFAIGGIDIGIIDIEIAIGGIAARVDCGAYCSQPYTDFESPFLDPESPILPGSPSFSSHLSCQGHLPSLITYLARVTFLL